MGFPITPTMKMRVETRENGAGLSGWRLRMLRRPREWSVLMLTTVVPRQYFTVPHLVRTDSAWTPSWPRIPSGVQVES